MTDLGRQGRPGKLRLTIELDADKARRLVEAAGRLGVSVGELLDEIATMALFDAEVTRAPRRPVVAPELEFFLVKINTDPDYPLEPPIGRSGRPETGRQAFGIDAVNEFDPIFEDVYASRPWHLEEQLAELRAAGPAPKQH